MVDRYDFEGIRPYKDLEVSPILNRLVHDPSFLEFVKYLFPDWNEAMLADKIGDIRTIGAFQGEIMYPAARNIVDRTIDHLSHSGFEHIKQEETYLFLSNHRDIILDSALLNMLLFEHGMDTVEVAIGSNLLIAPWITDLVKLNKNFVVHRSVPQSQLYAFSMRLSTYIRQKVAGKGSSIWIAQKEGRTKDGDDRTQAGLLKMFTISSTRDLAENLGELNIIPLSISYEYEPCDLLKAYELIMSREGDFKKKPEDDLKSMFVGVTGYKGRMHMATGGQLDPMMLRRVGEITNRNEQLKTLARHIDKQIHKNYKLWPTNYIAADLLEQGNRFSGHYTWEDQEAFEAHLVHKTDKFPQYREKLWEQMLKIYASSVYNHYQALQTGTA